MSIKSYLAQVFRQTTLPTILITAFGLQIVATGATIAYLSFLNGQKSIDNLVRQLQEQTTHQIIHQLNEYLSIPPRVNQLNKQAVALEMLNPQDWEKTAQYFWKQMQIYPVTRLEMGTFAGDYVGVELNSEQEVQIRQISRYEPNELIIWQPDEQGKPSKILETRSQAYSYPFQTWYIDSLNAQKTVWSQIEQRQRGNGEYDLSLSVSSPLCDPQKRVMGALGVEYSLSQLQQILKSLQISPSSQTFILERNGLLVASPAQKSLIKQQGVMERVNAPLAENPLVRQTSQYLIKHFQGLKNIQDAHTFRVKFQNQRQFIQVTPWQDEWGLDWLIVVVISEGDFMGEVHRQTQRTLGLGFIALLLSGILATFISRWLTRPLVRLSEASRAVQWDNLQQKVPEEGSKEISNLAQAFNQMLEEIARSRQQLETYSQSLEQTVLERTKALQQEMSERLQAETRYRIIFDQAVEGIYQTDPKGRYLRANPALASLYGYDSPEQLQNLEGQLYVEPQRWELFCRLLDEQDSLTNFESQIYRRDGSIIWIVEHARAVRNEQGKVLYYEGFVEDITTRKASEAALERAKIAAEEANFAKSKFIAHMSHELRSPLNVILGFARIMLRDRFSLGADYLTNLEIIERSGEHLLSLINQVLDFSKIEANAMSLNLHELDLKALLEDLQDMFSLKAQEKNLSLLFEADEQLPPYLHSDEMKLRQVLINLLNNAIKFTPRGCVLLQVLVLEKPESCPADHTMLYFGISDTGPGIKPEDLPGLFQAFVQTQTGLEAQEGTGLGLTISRKFVQLLGGDIQVSSEIDKGSTFSFTIPVRARSSPSQVTAQAQRRVVALAPDCPSYRILIVDDKPLNRQLLLKLLQPLGLALQEACNGQEAVDIADSWQPHLIWMDMRMPVLDGYHATQQIKTTLKGQGMAIIALTASVLEEEKAFILSAGCDDFLQKPFREEEIFDLMAKHLGITYLYEDNPLKVTNGQEIGHNNLDREIWLTLPQPWCVSLKEAILHADLAKTEQLLQEIALNHKEISNLIQSLIANYQYGKILDLISPELAHHDSGDS